jgi:hypothetical protein
MAGRLIFRHRLFPLRAKGGRLPNLTRPGLEVRVLLIAWSDRQIRRTGQTQQVAGGEVKGSHPTRTRGEGGQEKPLAREGPTVPQTDTGRRVEDTQARERTLVKELGKLTP